MCGRGKDPFTKWLSWKYSFIDLYTMDLI